MSKGAKRSLIIGSEKGGEEVGKAKEIVVQGCTDMASMARRKIQAENRADRANTTRVLGSLSPP